MSISKNYRCHCHRVTEDIDNRGHITQSLKSTLEEHFLKINSNWQMTMNKSLFNIQYSNIDFTFQIGVI